MDDITEEIKKLKAKLAKLENSLTSQTEPWEPEETIESKYLGIEVATNDYYEFINGEKKEYFTWEEACEIENKLNNGWRLPTVSEWVILAEEFCKDEDDDLSGEIAQSGKLRLGLNGYHDTTYNSLDLRASRGYYWSRSSYSTTNAYYLHFYSINVYPRDNSIKAYGYTVRLVREVK